MIKLENYLKKHKNKENFLIYKKNIFYLGFLKINIKIFLNKNYKFF